MAFKIGDGVYAYSSSYGRQYGKILDVDVSEVDGSECYLVYGQKIDGWYEPCELERAVA